MKRFLDIPKIFIFYQNLVGDKKYKKYITKNFLKIKDGDSILDLGCGPASLIPFLPGNIKYVGIDKSIEYINYASNKYKNHKFICSNSFDLKEGLENKFDIIISDALFMSLSNEEAHKTLSLITSLLKEDGTFFFMDGCYVENGAKIANWFLSKERGKNTRSENEYKNLLSKYFKNIEIKTNSKLYNIPHTKIMIRNTEVKTNTSIELPISNNQANK